jgi:hypothetical protein
MSKPDRAPMHTDDNGDPFTDFARQWFQPRDDARVPGLSEQMRAAAARIGQRNLSGQPANSGRFTPTVDFSEPARREADASRQPANMEPLAWFDILDTLIARAQAQHDHAATRTRMALFDTIVRWLEQQRETPPV